MAAPWEKYQSDIPEASGPWAKYGASAPTDEQTAAPVKIGADAFADTLRAELQGTDWATRNIAGAGSAVRGIYEGAKQLIGQGDRQAIEANKVIEDEAPVGAIAGNIAMTAIPFAAAGNSLKAAGAVGAGFGALQPVAGEQSFGNIAQGKAINSAIGGGMGVAGQAVANKAQSYLADKLQQLTAQKAMNAKRDEVLAAGRDMGMVVPPDMANPTMLNRLMTGFSGKLTTQQQASGKNQEVFNNAARKALGLPDDAPLTDEVLAAFRASKSGPYKELADMGQMPVDAAYDVGKRGPKIVGATKPQTVFMDDVGNVVSDVPAMPRPQSDMRNLVSEVIKSGGLSRSEMADMGLDAAAKTRPGLFRKEGRTADDLAMWMEQNGWLNQAQIDNANANSTGGAHDLARKWLKEAIDGQPVYHPSQDDLAYNFSKQLSEWGDQYGNLSKKQLPGDPGKIDAAEAVEKLKDLRFESKGYWNFYNRTGDPKARKAAKSYDGAAKQLEDFLERSAQNAGKADLVPQLRESRKAIAKAHTIGKALNDASGNVNPRVLAREKFLTDELKTAADFAKAFPKATQSVDTIGAMPGVSPLDFVSSGIMSGAGHAAGGPAGMLAGGVPFLRPITRAIALSDLYQRNLAMPSYALGTPTLTLGSLLKNAQIAGTVGGLQAFGQ